MKQCSKCGKFLDDDLNFCTECGSPLSDGTQQPQNQQPPYTDGYTYQTKPDGQNVYNPAPNAQFYAPTNTNEINQTLPEPYRLISSWGYVGYSLLFAIPLVGLILAIVYAFDNSYIARRNYARSFFCSMLIGVGIAVIMMTFIGLFAVSLS